MKKGGSGKSTKKPSPSKGFGSSPKPLKPILGDLGEDDTPENQDAMLETFFNSLESLDAEDQKDSPSKGFGSSPKPLKPIMLGDFGEDDTPENEEAMLETIFNSLESLDAEQQKELFGYELQKMVDYRDELYQADGHFPTGVAEASAKQYLERSYERSRALPHLFEMSMVNEMFVAPKEYAAKRYFGIKELCDWFATGNRRMGDVCDTYFEVPYNSDVRSSYSNQVYSTELLEKGTTHVDIGFTDLGTILTCRLADSQSDEGDSMPLRFLGYDNSTYAVAKSMVIWSMCKRSFEYLSTAEEHASAVMQVWYSTVWSSTTSKAFFETVQDLCVDTTSMAALHTTVSSLLQHWAASPGVELASAMTKTAHGKEGYPSSIGMLLQQADRVDMARYELTGAFGLLNNHDNDNNGMATATGSVVMFDCPAELSPPLPRDESVFSVLSIVDIVKVKSANQTLFACAQQHLHALTTRLISRAKKGEITVELRVGAVEEAEVVADISELKPWTMNWRNSLDYMSPSQFHAIAKACAKHGDTLHFGYSLIWMASVVGSSFLDFESQPVKMRTQLVRDSNDALASFVEASELGGLIRLPVKYAIGGGGGGGVVVVVV